MCVCAGTRNDEFIFGDRRAIFCLPLRWSSRSRPSTANRAQTARPRLCSRSAHPHHTASLTHIHCFFASPGPARWLLAARAQRGAALYHIERAPHARRRRCHLQRRRGRFESHQLEGPPRGFPHDGRHWVRVPAELSPHSRGELRPDDPGERRHDGQRRDGRRRDEWRRDERCDGIGEPRCAHPVGPHGPSLWDPMVSGQSGSVHGQARARFTQTHHRSERRAVRAATQAAMKATITITGGLCHM